MIWTSERGLAADASANLTSPLTQGSVTTIPVLQSPPESPRVLGRRFPAPSAPRMPRPTPQVRDGVVSPGESSSVLKHHSGFGVEAAGSPLRTGRHRAPRPARVRGRSSSTDVPIGTPDPVGSGHAGRSPGDGSAVELAAVAVVVVERLMKAEAIVPHDEHPDLP